MSTLPDQVRDDVASAASSASRTRSESEEELHVVENRLHAIVRRRGRGPVLDQDGVVAEEARVFERGHDTLVHIHAADE